jgi:hypothetical protein
MKQAEKNEPEKNERKYESLESKIQHLNQPWVSQENFRSSPWYVLKKAGKKMEM